MKGLLIPLICVAGMAAAQEPVPHQFALGFPINTPTAASIYRITLPKAIYRSTTRADLGDLRIFNADSEVVPHLIRHPRAVSTIGEGMLLPFFPLGASDEENPARGLRIAIDADGAIIETSAPQPEASAVSAYIIDAGEGHNTLAALDLQWQQESPGFVDQIRVSSSTDLLDWRDLGSVTLADLQHAGHRLQQNRIALNQPLDRYLRLAWPGGQAARALSAVQGQAQSTIEALPRQWSSLAGRPATDTERAFEFDSEAHYPVDRLRLALPQANSLLQVRWLSRDNATLPWRSLGSALQYRLDVNATPLRSTEFALARNPDRFWRIEILDGDAAALGAMPRLELGWAADELLFLARGKAPFQLAVGSVHVGAPGQSVNALLANLDDAAQTALSVTADLGKRHPLAGEAALTPTPPPVPWQRYLLWAILVAGVLLLARMAHSLYRQMNAG